MSELDALDTDQISFIAYWNVLSDGGMDPADFDPEETIDAMETHEVFDNGVDGTIGITFERLSTRFTNCRVKDDGWFIVWLDRTKYEERDDRHGVHDVLNDWSDNERPVKPHKDNLSRAIKRLYSKLPNRDSASFNYADVNIFNYEQPEATVLTIASVESWSDMEIQPIEGTTIEKSYAVGSSVGGGSGQYSRWIDNNGNKHDIDLKLLDVTDGLGIEEISMIETGSHSSGSLMIFWK